MRQGEENCAQENNGASFHQEERKTVLKEDNRRNQLLRLLKFLSTIAQPVLFALVWAPCYAARMKDIYLWRGNLAIAVLYGVLLLLLTRLYIAGQLYFSEMTFYHNGGMVAFEPCDLYTTMHAATDMVIANQCGRNDYALYTHGDNRVKLISTDTRGVGINRNIGLLASRADILPPGMNPPGFPATRKNFMPIKGLCRPERFPFSAL